MIGVISTAGDTFLGGDDFDLAIADHIRKRLSPMVSELFTNHQTNVRLNHAAEQLKRELAQKILQPFDTGWVVHRLVPA